MKYLKDFEARFKERESFSMREAKAFLKNKRISSNYLHFLIQYLLKKGRMYRLARGVYTFRQDLIVAGFAFKPFYYGLHQALSFHNLWGQASNPAIITPRKVRSGIREVMGANIVVRKIAPKMFFGFELERHFEYWLPVSTVEKTLIDFVYFRQKIPTEAKKALIERIDKKKLQAMLKKSPKWVKKRVERIDVIKPVMLKIVKNGKFEVLEE